MFWDEYFQAVNFTVHWNLFRHILTRILGLLKPEESLWTLNKRSVFTPRLMTLSMTASKTTTPLGTWNPVTAPLFICPPTTRLLSLFFSLSLTHTNTLSLLSILPYSFKRALCRYLRGFCVEVLRLHTSLSFGITTEKQHSHLHEKSNTGKEVGGS